MKIQSTLTQIQSVEDALQAIRAAFVAICPAQELLIIDFALLYWKKFLIVKNLEIVQSMIDAFTQESSSRGASAGEDLAADRARNKEFMALSKQFLALSRQQVSIMNAEARLRKLWTKLGQEFETEQAEEPKAVVPTQDPKLAPKPSPKAAKNGKIYHSPQRAIDLPISLLPNGEYLDAINPPKANYVVDALENVTYPVKAPMTYAEMRTKAQKQDFPFDHKKFFFRYPQMMPVGSSVGPDPDGKFLVRDHNGKYFEDRPPFIDILDAMAPEWLV